MIKQLNVTFRFFGARYGHAEVTMRRFPFLLRWCCFSHRLFFEFVSRNQKFKLDQEDVTVGLDCGEEELPVNRKGLTAQCSLQSWVISELML